MLSHMYRFPNKPAHGDRGPQVALHTLRPPSQVMPGAFLKYLACCENDVCQPFPFRGIISQRWLLIKLMGFIQLR